MVEEKGLVKGTESGLFKPLNRKQAAYLLRTVWPEAPDADVIKAAIICAQYDLNPLMKHVALIKFGKNWVPVLEIKATRIIAQRKHKYSYVDGPRIMTKKEQEDTFGEVDTANIWAITVLEEEKRRYPGYGSWPKAEQPYGMEKGNSKWNMAFIRSERNSIDKMAPGEIPRDLEVADETYMPAVNVRAEIAEGKAEFIEETEKQIAGLYPDGKPVPEPPMDSTFAALADQVKERLAEQTTGMPSSTSETPIPEASSPTVIPIDYGALETMMKDGHFNKDTTWKSWLRSKANYLNLDTSGTLKEVLARMDEAQLSFFMAVVRERTELK